MSRPRILAVAAAALLVAGFAAANAHLVIVAVGSQPDCVLTNPSTGGAATHRAAKPSC